MSCTPDLPCYGCPCPGPDCPGGGYCCDPPVCDGCGDCGGGAHECCLDNNCQAKCAALQFDLSVWQYQCAQKMTQAEYQCSLPATTCCCWDEDDGSCECNSSCQSSFKNVFIISFI